MTNKKLGMKPLVVNGWTLYFHPLFLESYNTLLAQVEGLKQKDPENFKKKKPTKILAAITKLIIEVIPEDPSLPEYRQGSTLGPEYKHWYRAKFFQQYRLFFRFNKAQKIIVYAWVNDEDHLRAYESATDAYKVFQRMLKNGNPPDDWDRLLAEMNYERKHSSK